MLEAFFARLYASSDSTRTQGNVFATKDAPAAGLSLRVDRLCYFWLVSVLSAQVHVQIKLCQCKNMHVHANITIRMCALTVDYDSTSKQGDGHCPCGRKHTPTQLHIFQIYTHIYIYIYIYVYQSQSDSVVNWKQCALEPFYASLTLLHVGHEE